MQFVYPAFLFALSALAIPIIIHLFNFRRFKRVYFTNVLFLREVKEETTSRNRLKHLLVLLMRMLAYTFLVLAFAQPFIPLEETRVKAGANAVSIYFDNSFSMDAMAGDLTALEEARNKAREIVKAYGPERFRLVTNDLKTKHRKFVTQEEMIDLIDEVTVSPSVLSLERAIKIQEEALQQSAAPNKTAFLITDMQRRTAGNTLPATDTTISFHLSPVAAQSVANLYIDSCWFFSPKPLRDQTSQLIVRYSNAGTEDVEAARLTLKLNDKVKALAEANVLAGASRQDTLSFMINEDGWHEAVLEVTDYPVSFDDNYYFSFHVEPNVPVLIINEEEENRFVNAIFQDNPFFLVENSGLGNLNYTTLGSYGLIVLNGLTSISTGLSHELQSYLEQGGNLILLPGPEMDLVSINSFTVQFGAGAYGSLNKTERKVASINIAQRIYGEVFEEIPENIDLPNVKQAFPLRRTAKMQELLSFKDGSLYLAAVSAGAGNLYLFGSPIDPKYTDLVGHAIFAPAMFRMAIITNNATNMSYRIGQDDVLNMASETGSAEEIFTVSGKGLEFIPAHRMIGRKAMLDLHGQISESGFYTVKRQSDEEGATVAFNYDRRESELDFLEEDEIAALIEETGISLLDADYQNMGRAIGEMNKGVVLWKLCIIFALMSLAAEVAILKFWK